MNNLPTGNLLPCPFCGSKAKWFKTGRNVGIECGDLDGCPARAQTDVYDIEHKDAAVGQWNMRSPDRVPLTDDQFSLCKFYDVTGLDDLITTMSKHIAKLQEKLPKNGELIRTHVREG